MNNKRKSEIVAAAAIVFLNDLRDRGLDPFEILSALCLCLVKSSKGMSVPKQAIMNVFSKLWDDLDDESKETFIMNLDIEA